MKYKKVYHISPENFSKFTPKYHRAFGHKGVFVSPNFKSAICDWMPYVFFRKGKKDEDPKESHHYENVYLYTLLVPEYDYQYAKIEFDHGISRETRESALFGFWMWGDQLFIDERFVKDMIIVKKKRYSYPEFIDAISYVYRVPSGIAVSGKILPLDK